MMVITALYYSNTLSLIIIVKQYWTDTPLGHIILIASQPVFPLIPKCSVLSGEASITNVIALQGLELILYRPRGKYTNNYTTDAVSLVRLKFVISKSNMLR